MIRPINKEEITECAELICASFQTVADTFGFTKENAPRFTVFATTPERLRYQLEEEHRPMYVYVDENGAIAGYYSLALLGDGICELNNLCVSPEHRHQKIGDALIKDAFRQAAALGLSKMEIGIVEENQVLRKWYESKGFRHIGTEKFDFFPFTCGYMERPLSQEDGTEQGAAIEKDMEQSTAVEKAGLSDIEALTELRLAYLTEDYGGLRDEEAAAIRRDLPGYYQTHLNRDLFAYVIREDRAIVSCAFLLLIEKPMNPSFLNGKTGEVLNVYTRPDHRRKGYAAAVMKKMLADAKKMDVTVIELKATDDGYPLYKSVGFSDDQSKYHPMKWVN